MAKLAANMKLQATALILLAAAALATRAATFNFDTDTGPELPSGWTTTTTNWAVKGGALWKTGKGERHFAIHEQTGSQSNLVHEATVTVRRREADGWAIAGLALHQDVSNLWHFALIEAPPAQGSKHYVELLETHAGIRHAQNADATRLICSVKEGNQFNWEFNKPYRIRLTLGGGKIEGTVHEPDGTPRARIAFLFENKPAVTTGRPALITSQLVTVFDDINIQTPPPSQSARP